MLRLKAVLAFLLLPGIFAFLNPWAISTLDPWGGSGWRVGFGVLGLGALILLYCVRDFYVIGKGTLAPWSPPQNLVIVGLYRYSRNPMYVGVLLVFAACTFHWRVTGYEEVVLSGQFPIQWTQYVENVPRWLFKP